MLRWMYAMLAAAGGVLFSASAPLELAFQPEEPSRPLVLGPPSTVVSEVTVQPAYDESDPPIRFGTFGTALSEVSIQPSDSPGAVPMPAAASATASQL